MNNLNRKKYYAIIHAAAKKAGLEGADYRAVLLQVTGVESAAKCSDAQLIKLADHFKSFGRPSGKPCRGRNYYHVIEGISNWKQKRHIAAMWVELGYKASGLDKRAQTQFGAADFLSLSGDQLQTLGRDLAKRLSRKKEKQSGGQ